MNWSLIKESYLTLQEEALVTFNQANFRIFYGSVNAIFISFFMELLMLLSHPSSILLCWVYRKQIVWFLNSYFFDLKGSKFRPKVNDKILDSELDTMVELNICYIFFKEEVIAHEEMK